MYVMIHKFFAYLLNKSLLIINVSNLTLNLIILILLKSLSCNSAQVKGFYCHSKTAATRKSSKNKSKIGSDWLFERFNLFPFFVSLF